MDSLQFFLTLRKLTIEKYCRFDETGLATVCPWERQQDEKPEQ